ncbi:hypothetical protein ACFFL1_06665 [Samsonia erythrinae]|nr:hypothetical protein [Samsonia erythrinae]
MSVNNTGHSNSQAPSTAISSTTTPASTKPESPPVSSDNSAIVDPITGKTLPAARTITLSSEAIERLKDTIANAPPSMRSKEGENTRQEQILKTRNLIQQSNTADTQPGINLSIDNMSMNKIAIEEWSNNLKADSDISKEAFIGLVNQALSKPSSVTTWSYTTDSIEITLKAAKLEELKNRYVDSSAHQKADQDIQDFIAYQSEALSHLEKNILQDEYQRSVDAGDSDKANTTFQELQKNAEGTSTTQLQRQNIFSLTASPNVDSWFDNFRHYISATTSDRYTQSEHLSVVSQFQSHWIQFQQQLK